MRDKLFQKYGIRLNAKIVLNTWKQSMAIQLMYWNKWESSDVWEFLASSSARQMYDKLTALEQEVLRARDVYRKKGKTKKEYDEFYERTFRLKSERLKDVVWEILTKWVKDNNKPKSYADKSGAYELTTAFTTLKAKVK